MLDVSKIKTELKLAQRMRDQSITHECIKFFEGEIHALKKVLELPIEEV